MDPRAVAILQVLTMLLGVGFVLSVVLVRLSVLVAHRYDVMARPSERGSHEVSTPRLGGLGVTLAFCLGLVTVVRITESTGSYEPWFWAMAVAGAWAFVGGLLDDIVDLPASNKFLFQSAAAIAMVLLGGGIREFDIPGYPTFYLCPLISGILTFLIVVFWINAYNFMDGMDGHAAGFAAVVGLGVAVPAFGYWPYSPVALSAALLIGCSFGLYTYNSPGVDQEKKTFMGDGGSHFLGLVMIALVLAVTHLPERADRPRVFPIGAGLILLFPFLYDVGFTLVRRALRRENLLRAHRSHLYQRLLVAGWSHTGSLALSQLTWLVCFLLSQKFANAGRRGLDGAEIQWLCLAGALGVMVLYTLIVLWVEASGKSRSPDTV